MSAYYFLAGDEVRGPFTMADCFLMIEQGTLTPASPICLEGHEDWRRLDTYPELKGYKRAVPQRIYAGPEALTICGGILLAVFILGFGGEVLVKYNENQELAAAAKRREAVRLANLESEAAEAREASVAANHRAEAAKIAQDAALALAQETPTPAPTATPFVHHLAPDGIFYVTEYVSVRTAKGVSAFEPGQTVKRVKPGAAKGTLVVSDGKVQGEIPTSNLTNDLDIAAAIIQRDRQDQAESQTAQQQGERIAALARHQIDLDHAASVATLPSGAVVGGHSTLDKPAEQVGAWGSSYSGDYYPADGSLRSVGGGQ